MEQLAQILAATLDEMRTNANRNTASTTNIEIPKFDPVRDDGGALRWCEELDQLGRTFNWTEYEKLTRATSGLIGEAKEWFSSWQPIEKSWITFTTEIANLYPPKRNLSEKFRKASLYTSNDAVTYCNVCGADSCCRPNLESRLVENSRIQLNKFLKDSLFGLSAVLETRAKRFDDFFRNLMANSKKEFHEMFKKTYGVIYLQHSFVFTDFFEELERYYNNGRVRLADALDNFFGILYQRMFTVINAQYQFNDRYLECVAEHMTELRPFGDVPHKLGVQLRRSFVATRAFYKALAKGAEVVRSMVSLTASEKCGLEMARMLHCEKCLGVKGPGSCYSYCISISQACLQYHVSLDIQWNNFVDALDKVADRLLGPFNIEMVVEPINIKISEAVMIFQENGAEVSQRIFSGCGTPVLQRRRRESSNEDRNAKVEEPRVEARKVKTAEDEITFESLNFNSDNNSNNSNKKKRKKVETVATLEKLIKDIKQRGKESRQFWSQLPYQFCNNEAAAPSANSNCWNGTALGRYEQQSQQTPSPPVSFPTVVNEQIFALQALVSKLQSAYQGQDVDLADDLDDMPNISGSGSGMDEIQGSGDHYDLGIPEVPRAESEPPPPSPSLPTSTAPPNVSQGSAAISGPTLAKALAHYLLPIVLVWFGGAFSDLLL